MTHICVGKLTIIDSDNGLLPGRRQAFIWTNAGILLIRTLGTNFSEILSEIQSFSFKKMHLKMSSAKWRLFCLGLNVLNWYRSVNVLAFYTWFAKHAHQMLCWRTTETQIPPTRIQEKWWMWVIAIVKRPRPQQKAKRRIAQTLPKARTRSWATQFLRSTTHCLEGCQPLWLQSRRKSCEMRWRRRCQHKSDFVAIKVRSLFPDEIIQTSFISIDEILHIGLH